MHSLLPAYNWHWCQLALFPFGVDVLHVSGCVGCCVVQYTVWSQFTIITVAVIVVVIVVAIWRVAIVIAIPRVLIEDVAGRSIIVSSGSVRPVEDVVTCAAVHVLVCYKYLYKYLNELPPKMYKFYYKLLTYFEPIYYKIDLYYILKFSLFFVL